MNLFRNGRLVVLLLVCVSCALILGILIIMNTSLYPQNRKKIILILPKREDWLQFKKLKAEVDKLGEGWKKQKVLVGYQDDLDLQKFINEEFGRQIEEIKRISDVEVQLKRAELDRAFQEYSKLRLKEIDQEYQQKLVVLNELVNGDIQRKFLELDQQYKNYQMELEKTHQIELVNLQLQLSVLELNPKKTGDSETKDKVKLKIDRIRQDINQKRQTQKQLFDVVFQNYEKQRRNEMDSELQTLKAELKNRFENDVNNYRRTLDSEFDEWCRKQNIQFEKAIQVRQGQKKKPQ